MSDPLAVTSFTRTERADLYDAYRRIKFAVFVSEQRWHGLSDERNAPIALEDRFDPHSHFCLAVADRQSLGIVRGTPIRDVFPYAEHLGHHLASAAGHAVSPEALCTLNGLAVLPDHRRREYTLADRPGKGTVARLLMLTIIRTMEERGLKGAMAITGTVASTRLCASLGFLIIDPPVRDSAVHEELVLTGVGLVFGSPAHRLAQLQAGMVPSQDGALPTNDSARLLHYFQQRQERLLQSHTLNALINEPERVAV